MDDLLKRAELSAVITDKNGNMLRNVFSDDGVTSESFVSSLEISDNLKKSVVAIEDRRFYSHFGIDIKSVARAVLENLKYGKLVSGGSTITQQLAKITLGYKKRTFFYKTLEALYALRMEIHLSKDDILTAYLNKVYFGSFIKGIGAASHYYFKIAPFDLSLAQSALLAGTILRPSYYDPHINLDAALERQKLVLNIMLENKLISYDDYSLAVSEKLSIYKSDIPFFAPHFCDYLIQFLHEKKIPLKGIFQTTLDLNLQREVEGILKASLEQLKERNVLNGAVMVVENKTGAILAMAGSKDYFSKGGQFNACFADRQAGSSLKPFLYAFAIDKGVAPSTVIPDVPITVSDLNGSFTPLNYDTLFHGPVMMRTALGASYNIPAVRMILNVGIGSFYDKLKDLGFEFKMPFEWYGAGLALGNADIGLFELVSAYRCFASGGKIISLSPLPNFSSCEEKSVFSPQAAYIIFDMLSDNMARAPAFGLNSILRLPFKCAVKTGTTQNYRDNWCVGVTADYTVGVWVGNFDNSVMQDISGVSGAGPILHQIMTLIYADMPSGDISKPSGLERVNVCKLSGMKASSCCRNTYVEFYVPELSEPLDDCEVCRIVKIDKRTGMKAAPFIPKDYIKEEIIEVLPPIYDQWLEEKGVIPFNAKFISDFLYRKSDVAIIFPSDHASFKIEPSVDPGCQKIVFQAACGDNGRKISWILNGKKIGETVFPFKMEWQLHEGIYRLEVFDGEKNDSVSFTVKR